MHRHYPTHAFAFAYFIEKMSESVSFGQHCISLGVELDKHEQIDIERRQPRTQEERVARNRSIEQVEVAIEP